MNRLNQKCFVGSAGFHLLLMVILLVGPAFLSSKSKSDNSPPLDVILRRDGDSEERGDVFVAAAERGLLREERDHVVL
jgi:hypothetical protein